MSEGGNSKEVQIEGMDDTVKADELRKAQSEDSEVNLDSIFDEETDSLHLSKSKLELSKSKLDVMLEDDDDELKDDA